MRPITPSDRDMLPPWMRTEAAHLAGSVLHHSPGDCLSLKARHWDSQARWLCIELPWSSRGGS